MQRVVVTETGIVHGSRYQNRRKTSMKVSNVAANSQQCHVPSQRHARRLIAFNAAILFHVRRGCPSAGTAQPATHESTAGGPYYQLVGPLLSVRTVLKAIEEQKIELIEDQNKTSLKRLEEFLGRGLRGSIVFHILTYDQVLT